jgi:hypothetical protein
MKRSILLVVLALALPLVLPQAGAQWRTPADPLRIPQHPGDVTVYVSKVDKHYHREACDHLRQDKHAISASEAKTAGYTRCGLCKPVK